ncbi:hypothetical protein P691DRAFT_785246 [Macrolepiota fuliginosa MF-IS2]|uniref:Uncharacterized protein n=1 Tax=Macrolepiota fuliginosa MF-IS2 TaxID=1400762 RepID=A0A9P6C1I9_9AGAR|nr:hypothetical protein P691DRAFT_785246 [Macrolepiota fuliginosa MF-IS2]
MHHVSSSKHQTPSAADPRVGPAFRTYGSGDDLGTLFVVMSQFGLDDQAASLMSDCSGSSTVGLSFLNYCGSIAESILYPELYAAAQDYAQCLLLSEFQANGANACCFGEVIILRVRTKITNMMFGNKGD